MRESCGSIVRFESTYADTLTRSRIEWDTPKLWRRLGAFPHLGGFRLIISCGSLTTNKNNRTRFPIAKYGQMILRYCRWLHRVHPNPWRREEHLSFLVRMPNFFSWRQERQEREYGALCTLVAAPQYPDSQIVHRHSLGKSDCAKGVARCTCAAHVHIDDAFAIALPYPERSITTWWSPRARTSPLLLLSLTWAFRLKLRSGRKGQSGKKWNRK